MKKIVVASDSFKGSVSSIEVAECAELAIHKVFPNCEVVKIPVGDGGEGTVETLITAMGGEAVSCVVHDPLMRSVEATYGILGDNRTAVIEMATASGLTLVPVSERNPLRTTTYGTGELIKDAMDTLRANLHTNIFLAGHLDNYSKMMYPEIREAWSQQIDMLVDRMYQIAQPKVRRIELIKK